MAKRSKRRSKKTPNLPQSAINRARQQIEGELDEEEDQEEAPEQQDAVPEEDVAPAPKDAVRLSSPRKERRRERERSDQPRQYSRRSKKDELTAAEIAEMLANPTKFVSEEELRAEYHYVIADLRSMGLLAASLMITLVVLAQFI